MINTDLHESNQMRLFKVTMELFTQKQVKKYKQLMISQTKQDFTLRCPNSNTHVFLLSFALTAVSDVTLNFLCKSKKTSLKEKIQYYRKNLYCIKVK
jgi:hypothetical protein